MKSMMGIKGQYVLVVVVMLVLAALIFGRTAEAQNTPPAQKVVKWEYTDGANLNVAQMNALGEQGWEMVTFVNYGGKDLYYVLKRPKY